MQILSINKVVYFHANKIKYGFFDEPNIEKYALYNDKDELMYYVLGDFELLTVNEVPDDIVEGKYIYNNGIFSENPDYKEVVNSDPVYLAEQLKSVEKENTELYSRIDKLENALMELLLR